MGVEEKEKKAIKDVIDADKEKNEDERKMEKEKVQVRYLNTLSVRKGTHAEADALKGCKQEV